MPKTDYEISTLMAGNDGFILSAVAAQLIKTVYFIFPSWANFDTFASKAHLGIAQMDQRQQFCTCYDADDGVCTTTNLEDPLNDSYIKPEQCPNDWPYDYLELIVGRTPGILRYSKKWSLKNMSAIQSELKRHPSATLADELKTPLILDIDEDFFGVHLPSRNLTDIGFTTEEVAEIGAMVHEIFCPKYPPLEKTIDEWFKRLTQRLINECLPSISGKDLSCVRALAMEILPTLHSNHKTWLCTSDVKHSFLDLMHFIAEHAMTTEKLNALARTGLCLDSAWSGHLYEPHMHLCVGHNTVNNSIVPEYVPSHKELVELAANFTRVLMALPYQPITVTVCRSSRDGYTPRWLQMRIEAIVLGLLKRVLKISQKAVHYSTHLAGGQNGWDKRWQ
ncbi:unnamed protein product [Calicophoron daubneyi]|uniref:Uncharacterized protein n=1 Tax=Calicophoron daubneyi TaxID=300641 RepID=A0AAV2TXA8_CALDB